MHRMAAPKKTCKECKADAKAKKDAMKAARGTNNLKEDGEAKPCSFRASFCGQKSRIYGRPKGAKNKPKMV